MLANFNSFLSWVSAEALKTSEPIVLLVLGGLFLMLSFRVRVRSKAANLPVPAAPRPVPHPSSALATQQSR
jgi:hypothetical protein